MKISFGRDVVFSHLTIYKPQGTEILNILPTSFNAYLFGALNHNQISKCIDQVLEQQQLLRYCY